MSEDKNAPTAQTELIPLDPQLTSNSQTGIQPNIIAQSSEVFDPIPLDSRLSSMLQKSLDPELIRLDTQLTSRMVEHSLTVSPSVIVENKSTSQSDTAQSQASKNNK